MEEFAEERPVGRWLLVALVAIAVLIVGVFVLSAFVTETLFYKTGDVVDGSETTFVNQTGHVIELVATDQIDDSEVVWSVTIAPNEGVAAVCDGGAFQPVDIDLAVRRVGGPFVALPSSLCDSDKAVITPSDLSS